MYHPGKSGFKFSKTYWYTNVYTNCILLSSSLFDRERHTCHTKYSSVFNNLQIRYARNLESKFTFLVAFMKNTKGIQCSISWLLQIKRAYFPKVLVHKICGHSLKRNNHHFINTSECKRIYRDVWSWSYFGRELISWGTFHRLSYFSTIHLSSVSVYGEYE